MYWQYKPSTFCTLFLITIEIVWSMNGNLIHCIVLHYIAQHSPRTSSTIWIGLNQNDSIVDVKINKFILVIYTTVMTRLTPPHHLVNGFGWSITSSIVCISYFYCLIQFYERCGNLPLRIQKASRKHPQRETLRPRDLWNLIRVMDIVFEKKWVLKNGNKNSRVFSYISISNRDNRCVESIPAQLLLDHAQMKIVHLLEEDCHHHCHCQHQHYHYAYKYKASSPLPSSLLPGTKPQLSVIRVG